MDTIKTNTAEIKWVLCSPNFDDIIHISPKGLNTIQIEPKNQKTFIKNIRRVYFNLVRVAQKQTAKKNNETISHG